MKYFTPELWQSWQDPDAPASDADPFAAYRAELETLKGRISSAAFQFFAEADVHDGELIECRVSDGSRPAPLGQPRREWATQPTLPVTAALRVLDAMDKFVWTLLYRHVRRVAVAYPGQLFHDEGRGFGDWGYHELTDAGGGFLRHEVLFSSGSTILIEFRDVAVQSEEARGAAEQGVEADEA